MQRLATLRQGLLLLAGLLLTIHTVVPHVHGSPFSDASVPMAIQPPPALTGWLGILGDLVSGDMGEEHLEHFAPEKIDQLALSLTPTLQDFPPSPLYWSSPPVSVCSSSKIRIVAPPDLIIASDYQQFFAARGPPTVK